MHPDSVDVPAPVQGGRMTTLDLIYGLAAAGALGLFVYLGYALLRPERF